jgi:tellurite resistance protein TerC
MIFPFDQYWWFYGCFTLFVLALLAMDLGIFHRDAHEVSFREALFWSVAWVSLALVFCISLYVYCNWKFSLDPGLLAIRNIRPEIMARQSALEFLTGFFIEKSLALDNIFVFYIVFKFFAIPARYQHRVLFLGIVGALLFRTIFIALGAVLLRYEYFVILFGVFLILTGMKIFVAPSNPPDLEKNVVIRLMRRLIPVSGLDGQRFFTRIADKVHATPLFIALVFVEASDILFALDSVPAIFAVTKEPLIVFTSNMFAILGLRAMYFLLAGMVPRFHLMKYGLALILIFVGLKMTWLNGIFGGKFPITWSLGIILLLLASSITASLIVRPRQPREESCGS